MGAVRVVGRRGIGSVLAATVLLLAASPAAHPTAEAQPRTARVSPPVTLPASPDGLPAQADWGKRIEPLASYQPQLSCAAGPMPGLAALRDLALASYDRGYDGGSIRSCATGGASEHKDGRAWDWMLDVHNTADRRVAGDFLSWLLATRGGETAAMARRLGVMYVIYNRKIWATYSPGWRAYTGADPHTSHIHISLSWNGGRGTTSFWKGSVPRADYGTCAFFSDQPAAVAPQRPRTRPCPQPVGSPRASSRSFAWLGSSGVDVRRAKQVLGVDASSAVFDRATRTRLMRYQVRHDLPRTGALDEPTWASLEPATRSQSVPRWTPSSAAAWGQRYHGPALHRSSAGKAVYAVQVALRMPDPLRTGFLGRLTAQAVSQFRTDHGMSPGSRVTAQVWAVLPG